MDNFLTRLFAEEQEKVASAELGQFMGQLSTDELEDFLGIRKVAVEGKPEPSLPDSLPTGKLEALQQQKRDYVDQEHEGKPKGVADQPEGAQTRVKYEGPGKEATGKTAEDAATEKVAWADRCGRLFAKQAACAMTKTDEFTNPAAKAKAKAFSATLKASKGQPLATRKAALQGTEKAIEKKAFLPGAIAGYMAQGDPEATPRSGFWRGAGGGMLGSLAGAPTGALIGGALGGAEGANIGSGLGALAGNIGGGYLGGRTARATPEEMEAYLASKAKKGKKKESEGIPEGDGAGMESTASVKAKIASMALKVSAGAPEHIKSAAAFLAGREIAELNK